jgi:hypothetical protein
MPGFDPSSLATDPSAQAPPDPASSLQAQNPDLSGQSQQQPQQQQAPQQDQGPPQPPQQPKPQGGIVKQLLTNFFSGAGDAMLTHVGLPTPYEQAQTEYKSKLLAYNSQQINQLKQAQAALAQAKAGTAEQQPTTAATVANIKNIPALANMGLRPDGTPMGDDEMSPALKSKVALQRSLSDVASAKADLESAQNDPNSPLFKEKQREYNGKLALLNKQLQVKATATAGKGSLLDQPTAQRANKADLAVNIQQNVGDLKNLIDSEPDLFGKIAGRFTTAAQMIGSNDPVIAKVGIAVHNAALANNSIHGIRSAQGAEATERILLNHFLNGPGATKAALDEMSRSANTFVDAAKLGKRAPTGNAPTLQPTHRYNLQTGKIEAIGGG